MQEKSIFLSYSWNDSELANTIDGELQKIGFIVRRDIRDIGPWKSIKEFMSEIRDQDYAVIIISANYLKSPNCMYEVMELLKDTYYKNKIFSIVTDNADIYSPISRAGYISYWEEETKKLEEAISPLKLENTSELTIVLRRYRSIEMTIGSFLEFISDRNNPQIVNATNQIKEIILNSNIITPSSINKYEDNIKIKLEACHYAFLKFAALSDVSGTPVEKMIGIKKLDDNSSRYEYDLPMLTCEVTNCSMKTRIMEEPNIQGEIELNSSSVESISFGIMPKEMKLLEPGGKVEFSLHGKIMVNLIYAFLENKIKNISVKDNFGFCYYVPQDQIEKVVCYFKKYCFNIAELKIQHDKYCL